MKLSSPVFQNSDFLPDKYTCHGPNINPPLFINDVPPASKSLVLIVNDPDAPSGTWTHWLLWNVPPDIGEIAENSLPSSAVEGTTSWGQPGYRGPCPPSGTHRYFFKIFALDTTLNLPSSSTADQLMVVMDNHIIDQAELVARYSSK